MYIHICALLCTSHLTMQCNKTVKFITKKSQTDELLDFLLDFWILGSNLGVRTKLVCVCVYHAVCSGCHVK